MHQSSADFSGLFRLISKPRKMFYIIVSTKSAFFFFNFDMRLGGGCILAAASLGARLWEGAASRQQPLWVRAYCCNRPTTRSATLTVVYKSSSTRYVIQQFGTYYSYSMEITWMQNRTDSFFLNGEYLTKYQENYCIVYL